MITFKPRMTNLVVRGCDRPYADERYNAHPATVDLDQRVGQILRSNPKINHSQALLQAMIERD